METASVFGNIISIQHFSIHDGPGIRSTVFFQGCPLHCLWCHNPESHAFLAFVGFNAQKCVSCGRCAAVCPHGCHRMEQGVHTFDRAGCDACGRCVDQCLSGSLQMVGRRAAAEELAAEVVKDRKFFEHTGGGVTLSGGEPAMQPDFALALLQSFGRQGIHRAVETCGYADRQVYERLLPETDLFLYDCKETDPQLHRKYTGVDNEKILENLRFLHDSGAHVLLRCPIIPGLNDRDEHLEKLAALYHSLPRLVGIELLPYHALGASKTKTMALRAQEEYQTPAPETVAAWNERLRRCGVAPVLR